MVPMTTVLLLLSSMASLGHPASQASLQSPTDVLKLIKDLFDGNISLPTVDFDRLSHLARGSKRCGDKFFCKVHVLMVKHPETLVIARHINKYNDLKKFKCEDVLQKLQPTGNKYRMPLLKKDVVGCIHYRIWHSTPAPSTNATQPSE